MAQQTRSESPNIDRALADVLSIAGHELAHPLAVAMACAKLIAIPSPALDSDHRQEILDTLVRSLDQLSSLIRDLELTGSTDLLGDVNEEKLAGKRELMTMGGVLDQAVEDFGFSHPQRHVELVRQEDLWVSLDPPRFRQVMSNLLSNAAKFSEEGTTISVGGRRDSSSVIVSVSNEGNGFTPEDADRIFNKTVRLDELVSGRGWGLYVARAIVEAHGGKLWAEGIPGRGASFFVRLPGASNGGSTQAGVGRGPVNSVRTQRQGI